MMVEWPSAEQWLAPSWHPHPAVRVLVTTRAGNVSPAPWGGFNLGLNCNDDPQRVLRARDHLRQSLKLTEIHWLQQVHGIAVVESSATQREADGVIARVPGEAAAVLTADCLPVLLADEQGTVVAALHAGWRGLVAGIIEQGVAQLGVPVGTVHAWLGPAISQRNYQVDDRVREACLAQSPECAPAFIADGIGHWRFSLVQAATTQLQRLGVASVAGGNDCTFDDPRFYSFRRASLTGRFASLIWLEKPDS